MPDALREAVVEWLESERLGMSRSDLVREIDRMAKHSKLWPLASKGQWNAAVDETISLGLVTEEHGILRVVTKPVVQEAQEAQKQLELF